MDLKTSDGGSPDRILRRVARYVLEKLHVYGLYSLSRRGPLHDDGWFRSFQEHRSVDRAGNPLPFITYPAIEFLLRRVRGDMSVFEYGAGASTLWWAARVKEVIACEHDRGWYERISAQTPPNVTMIYEALEYGGAYAKIIRQFQARFDIIVIDGRDRVNCAVNCPPALTSEGVILWDDSNRSKYEAGHRFLFEHGFRKIEFVGMGPIANEKLETAIFYRSGNCLGI
jgi:hypothetical protein